MFHQFMKEKKFMELITVLCLLSRKDAERCDTSPIPTSTALRPNTSLCSMCIQGFIRLITNKRWAWAISTCIDSLMGSNMEMGTLSHSQC